MKNPFRIENRFRLICAACLIIVLAASQGCTRTRAFSFSRVNPFLGKGVKKSLDAAVAEFKVPGAVLAMRDMDGNTLFWTSGVAVLKSGKPMSKELYFRVGSVTKSYTATIVLQLVDEGKISLEDAIGKHLPGLVPRENEISVRHLLEMRSGLGSYGTNEEFAKMAEKYPIERNPHIEGFPNRQGVISLDKRPLEKGWTLEHYLFRSGTEYCLTLETPVHLPMQKRVEMHLFALKTSLQLLHQMRRKNVCPSKNRNHTIE